MNKSTKIFEKKVKKEFYNLIEELRLFNTKRWQIPFYQLSIDFYYNDKTDFEALFNYSTCSIYFNSFYNNVDNIRYVLIHEITHFLIYCSFDNSKNLFTKNEMFKLHSKHTLFFSIYCDLLNLIFKTCSYDSLLNLYNYHEDLDFEKIKLYLDKKEYLNTLINFGEKITDYYDLFLTSIYIYNYLKVGEIIPSNQCDDFDLIEID